MTHASDCCVAVEAFFGGRLERGPRRGLRELAIGVTKLKCEADDGMPKRKPPTE